MITKFCKDCKFVLPSKEANVIDKFALCSYPKSHYTSDFTPGEPGVDPITGEQTPIKHGYCSVQRSDVGLPLCGSEARWFEPK